MLKTDQISNFFLVKKKLKFKKNRNKNYKKKSKFNFFFKINNYVIKKKYIKIQKKENTFFFIIKNINLENIKIKNLYLILYLDKELFLKLKEKLYIFNLLIIEMHFSKSIFFINLNLLLYDIKSFNLKRYKKKHIINLKDLTLNFKSEVCFLFKKNKHLNILEIWERGKNNIYTFWSNISFKV